MKLTKKWLPFGLAAVMTLSLMVPAMATSTSGDEVEQIPAVPSTTQEISITEYERFNALKEMDSKELEANGYSEKDIEEIRNFSYETALFERAQLSEEELHDLGYTDEAIKILKGYDGSKLTAGSEVMSIIPTCTSEIKFVTSSNKMIQYRYSWEWNVAPVFLGTDGVATCWQTITPEATYVDGLSVGGLVTVKYVNGSATSSVTLSPAAEDITCSTACKFPMTKTISGLDGYWAKSGELYNSVSIPSSSPYEISYIKVNTVYGHAKATASISFSCSVSGPSISVAPARVTSKEAPQVVKITRAGVVSKL